MSSIITIIQGSGIAVDIGVLISMSRRFASVFEIQTAQEDIVYKIVRKIKLHMGTEKNAQNSEIDVVVKAEKAWKPIQLLTTSYLYFSPS